MGEERRYADLRMDNMEEDLRDLKIAHSVVALSVAEIREKIFNGFSHAIDESHQNTKELKRAVEKLDRAISEIRAAVFKTPEQRLADCPFKKEMIGSYEKKLRVYLTLGAIFVAAAAGLPGWIRVIIGG